MKLLERHFEIALETPDGITKLRELILSLAMEGKLVHQNSGDQPASELLKEIETEKKRLIKVGNLKKLEPLPPIKPEEIPYEVPKGWEWLRLGDCSHIERGGSPRPIEAYITTDSTGLNWIKIGDTEKNSKFITSTKEKIRKEGLIKTRMVYPGDFLLTNSMSYGRPYISKIEGCIHDGWLRIRPPSTLNKDYLYNLLLSPYIRKSFFQAASGAVVQNLNADKVRDLIIPLPPLAEQKRIVAKIDQLMALCDKLETEKNGRKGKRLAMHAAAINRLLTAADKSSFNTACSFINKNFSTLYSVPENVEDLKKAILQLAVMGKLVSQNPNDRPASELLKEIETEKQKLINNGKIKKQDPPTPIKPEEMPFELPKEWVWTRLDTISEYIQRGKGPIYSEIKKVPVISQKCIQWSGFDKDVVKFIDPDSVAQYQSERFILNGDLLWNSTGTGTIGRINIYKDELHEYPKAVADSHVTVVRTMIVNRDYILNFLMSPIVQNDLEENASGTTNQIELNTTMVKNQLIPLPPLNEQKRIVTKIDQLMKLCNTLGQQIKDSTEKQTAILDAVLARL